MLRTLPPPSSRRKPGPIKFSRRGQRRAVDSIQGVPAFAGMTKMGIAMPIVYSTHPLHPNAAALLAGHADLVIASNLSDETLTYEAKSADIIIVRANLPEALFANAAKLKAAIRHGAGLDMIPVEAATAAGVLVAN